MTIHHARRLLPALALLLPLLGCDSGGTGPSPFAGDLGLRFSGVTGRPFAVRVLASGEMYVTQQDANSVARLVVSSGQPRIPIPVGTDPGDVVFTSDGRQAIVSTFIGGDLHLIDVASGEEDDVVPIGTNAYRLALSLDDARVFVTTTTGRVYAVDRASATVVDSVTLSGPLQGLARRRSDGRLAVTSTGGGVWLLDPATLDIIEDGTVPTGAQDLDYSPDGSALFVAIEAGWVAVLNAQTLAVVDSIGFPAITPMAPFGLAVSPDGRHLVVTSAATSRVAVVDLATRAPRLNHFVGGAPRRVAFSPGGRVAVVANEGNWVDVRR